MGGADQAHVPVVQRPHGGHKPDGLARPSQGLGDASHVMDLPDDLHKSVSSEQ
jgi:hypothetical protein